MQIDWKPLRRIFDANQRFVITSHVRPDADALGSELALASMLEALGKSVIIVNPSETPPNLAFLDPSNRIKKIGQQISPEEVADTDVHIVLDTSAWVQLQDVGRVLRQTKATKVVIDHHFSADDLGAMEFKDPTSEATGALVFHMAKALGLAISAKTAMFLFSAIATDTGWFRFSSTKADTLRVAAKLIDAGAQPNLIYEQLYEQFSHNRMRLSGIALSRMMVDCGGKLAYTWVTQEDFAETNAKPVDTEDLVNECLRIAGTECAFIAIEQVNKSFKVSFRCRPSF
jgi:phosphoesterase RecJ-like protein